MTFTAEINIMPRKELLDPQGKTVVNNLDHIGVEGVTDMRIGKHITMTLEANSEDDAREKVNTACEKLLANIIMETYEFTLHEMETETT